MKLTHPGKIQLGEHEWELPPLPAKESDILFINEKKEDQYWRRQDDFPEEFFGFGPYTKVNAEYTRWDEIDGTRTVVALSKEDTRKIKELRDRELHRREHGVWFMNNGEPTYLTGDHYFSLQWCRIKGGHVKSGYGGYREFQAKFFYFIQMCIEDPNCTGGFIVKPKKTGITMQLMYAFLNRLTMTPELNAGAMSIDQKYCKDSNMAYIKYGLDNLPYIWLPSMGKDNEDEIHFDVVRKKNTGTKASQMKQMGNSKGLKSLFKAAASVENAFDGVIWNLINLDELPKTKAPGPTKIYERTKETVKVQGLLVGKIFVTSYTPEFDNESFKEGRKLYYDSKLDTRDPRTNQTRSELYAYAISAIESYDPPGTAGFDKYGKIDQKLTIAYLDSKREQYEKGNDVQKLQSFIRQYPKNEEEAWRIGGGGGSRFNNVRLGKRYGQVDEAIRQGGITYIEGTLAWKQERLGPVTFVQITQDEKLAGREGRWRIYDPRTLTHPIKGHMLNHPVEKNLRDDNGRLRPATTTLYIGASDPTDYVLKQDVAVGSKNAITVMNFPDVAQNTYYKKRVTDRLVAEYLYRPDSPREYYEDLVKAILYFGMYIIVEANKPWVITKLKEDGLQNFLLVRDKERKIVPYVEYEVSFPTTTTKEVIEDYCRSFEDYIEDRGPDITNGLDMINSERLLDEAMRFDTEDTKRFDLMVCFAYNLMGKDSFMAYLKSLNDEDARYDAGVFDVIARRLLS